MTLNWIATRTQDTRAFHPGGVDSRHAAPPAGMDLLSRGSLLIEVTVRPNARPVNLLRFAALDPWPSGLTICLEPDGTLRLMMRQGARHLETALKTTLGQASQTVHITYIWDAPARSGFLCAYLPDRGIIWRAQVMAPFPISLRDARRIVRNPASCTMDRDVSFVAIADAPCPLGPIPGLSGAAAVDTPTGPVALRNIKAGDTVCVEGGAPVRVLWSGCASVPALGRFKPMTLRRPYMGLWDDLVASRDQRVCLAGSEVEYLFGEERVTTAIRHLEVRNCTAATETAPAVVTYHQILLETHEIITVNGALLESFDGSAVINTQGLLKTSVMADMQAGARPLRMGLAAPVLQGYEALTLTGVSIG